ncbi:hypothetical protein ACFOZ0_34855 [Streptomyces yaanensis]|uniref:Uncharacterized protein n=1 Tax=Streptomyces yaanensis TaxID=1142239 RepID=A0ABV7SRP1_9ACTN|nr:hypothetical protein [Streptomyces sp. CGMCC 4.7035]WNB97305.1 hypothetical protein Q2K21_04020 [Streptomyces sp. CGMCC 4.7035]
MSTSGAPAGPVISVTETVPAVSRVVRQVVRPVADGLVRPAGDRVGRPVGGLVQTVAEGLADAPSQWSTLPSLPSVPGLPGLPAVPGLPGLPGVPTPPVHTVPALSVAQQPGGGTEHGTTAEQRQTGAYGPGVPAATDATAGEHTHRAPDLGRTAHLPRHQAPGGDPTGALGEQPAVDSGAPRHGDGHAVASNHRAPLRLVPGATAVATAGGTRDRHRDIPEFPG